MSFLPAEGSLLQIPLVLRKGWSCLGPGRKASSQEAKSVDKLLSTWGSSLGKCRKREEEEKVKERTCIKCQMGLSLDFSNHLNAIQFSIQPPGILCRGILEPYLQKFNKRRDSHFNPEVLVPFLHVINENTTSVLRVKLPISLRITVSYENTFLFLLLVFWGSGKKKIYGHSHTLTKVSEYIQPNFKELSVTFTYCSQTLQSHLQNSFSLLFPLSFFLLPPFFLLSFFLFSLFHFLFLCWIYMNIQSKKWWVT